jgi:hypothetical protein
MISHDSSPTPDPAGVDLQPDYSVDVTALVKRKLAEFSIDEQTTIAPPRN